jgi:hypothetical protein
LNQLTRSVEKPTFKTHLLYWIFPFFLTITYIWLYFFNTFNLSQVIAPEFNREFGLVENTQLVILLVIIYFSYLGFKKRQEQIVRSGFVVIALLTTLLFFEEIDYGLHYFDYLTGRSKEELIREIVIEKKVRNIHNNGKLTSVIKMTSYILIVLFFVVLPLLPKKTKEKFPIVNFLSPSKNIIATVICLFITNQIALYLDRNYDYTNLSLQGNISEFEEMMTHYCILLYVRELVYKPKGLIREFYRIKGN